MRGKISKSSLHPTDYKNVWVGKRGWQINQERKKKSYKWKQGHQGVLPQRRVRWFISQAHYPSRAVSSGFTYKSNNAKFTWSRLSFTSFCYLNFTKRPQCNMRWNVLFFFGNFANTPVETSAAFSVCVHVRECATKPKQAIRCLHDVLPRTRLRRAALSQTQWHHLCWRRRCPLAADPGSLPSDSPGRGSQTCPEHCRLSCAICKKKREGENWRLSLGGEVLFKI